MTVLTEAEINSACHGPLATAAGMKMLRRATKAQAESKWVFLGCNCMVVYDISLSSVLDFPWSRRLSASSPTSVASSARTEEVEACPHEGSY